MAKYYWYVETQSEKLIGEPLYDQDDSRDQEITSSSGASNEQRLLEVPAGVDEKFVKIFNNAGTLELQADPDKAKDDYRSKRTSKLSSSDWTQSSDSPLVAQSKTDWATYRQALRDWPSSPDSTAEKEWSMSAASGASMDMKLAADASGPAGNSIKFDYLDPAANNQPLAATWDSSAKKMSVIGQTNGAGDMISTLQEMIDAINATAYSGLASLSSGATGSNVADQPIAEEVLEGGGDVYQPYWTKDPSGNQ